MSLLRPGVIKQHKTKPDTKLLAVMIVVCLSVLACIFRDDAHQMNKGMTM